jgi:hypothetical protein
VTTERGVIEAGSDVITVTADRYQSTNTRSGCSYVVEKQPDGELLLYEVGQVGVLLSKEESDALREFLRA